MSSGSDPSGGWFKYSNEGAQGNVGTIWLKKKTKGPMTSNSLKLNF